MVVICNSSVQMVNCNFLNGGAAGSGIRGKITFFLVKSADFEEISTFPAKIGMTLGQSVPILLPHGKKTKKATKRSPVED